MIPLFAFSLNAARLAQLVVNLFAVAGGFLVGYVLTILFGWLLERFLFKFKFASGVHKIARMLGGIALAVLVAMIVFGHGIGWNLFGGGADGDGNGETGGQTAPATGATNPTPGDNPTAAPVPSAPKAIPTTQERIRITILGGRDVKDAKFYLIDDEPSPRSFAEVKAAVQKKKETTTKPFGLELRFAGQNAIVANHGSVLQLSTWARETAGLTVTFPAETP